QYIKNYVNNQIIINKPVPFVFHKLLIHASMLNDPLVPYIISGSPGEVLKLLFSDVENNYSDFGGTVITPMDNSSGVSIITAPVTGVYEVAIQVVSNVPQTTRNTPTYP